MTINGTAGNTQIALLGNGARTLTLTGGTTGVNTLALGIIDQGGPTSLVKTFTNAGTSNTGTAPWVLSGTNSYTGTTTITGGELQLASAGALPGGLGYLVASGATPTNTGGNNLIFNGSGTNNAVLELTAASGNFYRPVGTGFDQVSWNAGANGGFAANGTNMTVNLGGNATPTTLVWNSTASFLTTGNLIFGGTQATAAINLQNGLDLNGVARTVQVDKATATTVSVYPGIISGTINNSGTTATFTKTSGGALELSSTVQGTGTVNVTLSAGWLAFTNGTTAVPGAANTGRVITVPVNLGVVLVGASDPTILSRIVTTSAGSLSLDTSSSTAFDFSAQTGGFMLGAFSSPGGTPVYYSGAITPATISGAPTYRFGNAVQASANTVTGSAATAIQTDVNLLVLNGQNMLSGSNAAAFNGQGPIYVTGANTYTGGTSIAESTGGSSNQVVGLGNDSALGTGTVTFGAGGFISSLNADRLVSNNLISAAGLGASNALVNGNLANDNMVNVGAISFLGNVNDSTQTTGGFFTRGATTPALFFGDVVTSSSNQWNLNSGTFELLTTPNGAVSKTLNAAAKGISLTAASLYFDSDNALGTVGASATSNYLNIVTASTVGVVPGAGAVTLSSKRGISITANIAATFNVPGGPLVGTSNLVIPGIITGGGTGAFTKSGLGTLTLQGQNTFTATAATGITVQGGSLVLDFANSTATSMLASSPLITLGVANGAYGNGGTLLVTSGASTAVNQTIGNVSIVGKGNAITLTSGGANITLTIGTLTQGTNGNPMVALTVPVGSAINSSAANDAGGLIAYASFNGTDFATVSGGSIVAYSGYTVLSGSTPTITSSAISNVQIDGTSTGNPTLSGATTLLNTLKYSDTNARTINIGTGNTLYLGGTGGGDFGYVGTILSASGAGALTIGVSGSAGSLSAGTVTNNVAVLHFMNYSSNPIVVNSAIVNNGTSAVNPTIDAGAVTFAGANTFTGNILIENGATLNYNDGSAAGKSLGTLTAGAGNIVLNGGTLSYVGVAASNNLIYGITMNAPSAFNIPTNFTVNQTAQGLNGLSNVPGLLQVTGGGTLTVSGATDDPNASVEVVNGIFNLGKTSAAAIHSVSGNAGGVALIIDSGAKAVITGTGGDQIQDGSSVVVKGTGIFDLKGASEAFDGLSGNGVVTSSTTASTLTLGGSATVSNNLLNISPYTLNAANAGMASTGLNNFSGSITGAISLVKNGSGNQILSSAATLGYTGTTTINAGSLIMGAANVLPTNTAVTIVGNTAINGLTVPGNLNLGGYSLGIGSLSSTTGGTVTDTPTLSNNGTAWGTTVGSAFSTSATSGSDTLTVGNGNGSGSFNGVLQNGYTIIPVAGSGAGTSVTGILALTKVGTGTQTLSGANTYAGPTTISAGTLQAGAQNTFSPNSAVTINNSATLDLGGFNQTILSLASSSATSVVTNSGSGATTQTLTIANGGGANFAGVIQNGATNAIALTLTSGTQILSGANTYSGVTTINGGTLQIGNGGSTGTLGSGLVTDNGTLAINQSGTFTIGSANAISGSGSLAQNGAGNTTLTGANSYQGGTFVNAGTLTVTNTGALAGGAVGALTVAPGASFVQQYGAIGTQSISTLTVGTTGASNPATLTFEIGNASAGADQLNVTANSAGSASVGMTGASIVITKLAGITSITPGQYNLIQASGTGGTVTGAANVALATTSLNVGTQTYSLSLSNNNTTESLTVRSANYYWAGGNAGGATSWSTAVGNTTNWRTDASSNLDTMFLPNDIPSNIPNIFFSTSTPTAANLATTLDASYTINSLTFTNIGGGAVSIGNGTAGPWTLTINGGGIAMNSGAAAATISAAVALGASQIWTNSSSALLSVTGGITGSGTQLLTLNAASAGNISLTGGISSGGTLGLTVSSSGSGLVILGGTNIYSGATSLNGGTLSAGAAGAFSPNSAVTLANVAGATFDLNNFNQTIASLAGGGATGGNVTTGLVGGGILTIGNGGGASFGGVISGNGGLTMSGTGTQTLTNVNTYIGPTVVNAGTLTVTNTGLLGTGALTVSNPNSGVGTNVALNLNQNQTVGSLSGTIATPTSGTNTAQINLNNGMTLTIVQSASQSFAGAIAGNGSILIGAGSTATLTLTGQSTYLGSTDIDPGAIRLGVANALPITTFLIVNTGATFDLNNFSQQVASLSDGGTIPGGSVLTGGGGGGTLSINNTVSTNATSFSGVISQNGGLTLMSTNVATLTLTGLNTYAGATSVQGGTLTVSSTGSLGTGAVTVSNPNTGPGTDVILNLNNAAQTVGTLSGTIATPSSGTNTAQINLGTNTALTVNQTAAGTYAGIINGGTGSVTLGASSNNALTLTGQNTYGGGTTINGGTLVANNGSGSATGTGNVTVNNSGTLAGIGTIAPTGANAVSVNNGGTIRGGFADSVNNYGTLSINANVTINSTNSTGGTIQTEVARTGMGTVAGSNSLINLTGASAATFSLGAIGSPLGGGKLFTINVIDTTGSLLASDGSYTINLAKAGIATTVGSPTNFYLVNSGGITQLNAGQTIDSGSGLGAGGAGSYAQVTMTGATNFAPAVTSWTLNLDSTGQFMQLTLSTATPEPHHLLFACSVALGLVMLIRRRWRARCGIVN